MYFIPRNNTFYNYIAHASKKRRYSATFFCAISLALFIVYFVYFPLIANIIFYQQECMRLKKQYLELDEFRKVVKDHTLTIQAKNKKIAYNSFSTEKSKTYCHNCILKIVDCIAKSNLSLISYSSCNQKNKEWYNKNSLHFSVVGTTNQLLSFLTALKDEQSQCSINQLNLEKKDDTTFVMNFQINFLLVKENKNPST